MGRDEGKIGMGKNEGKKEKEEGVRGRYEWLVMKGI